MTELDSVTQEDVTRFSFLPNEYRVIAESFFHDEQAETEAVSQPFPGPEIIDPYTEEGTQYLQEHFFAVLARLPEAEQRKIFVDHLRPYNSGAQELQELFNYYTRVLPNFDFHQPDVYQKLEQHIAVFLRQKGSDDETIQKILHILKKRQVLSDLIELVGGLQHHAASEEIIQREARWIKMPDDPLPAAFIGPEAMRLLKRSRSIGLIPFEVFHLFEKMKIVVMGSSVAASVCDGLVVGLGAENIVFADAGRNSPSNERFPAGMGGWRKNGLPKARNLQEILQDRNPYGSYTGIVGKVIFDETHRTNPQDVLFDEFAKDVFYLVEVVDDVPSKTKAHSTRLGLISQEGKVVFAADVYPKPFGGIENPANERPFSQNLSASELNAMEHPTSKADVLRDVYKMLGDKFTPEHLVAYLLTVSGLVPFLPQTAFSAIQTEHLTPTVMALNAMGELPTGKNYTPDEVSQGVAPEMLPEEKELFSSVFQNLFPRQN